jgi:hypothetical protein
MSKDPLAGRPGLETVSPKLDPKARELGEFAKRHGLCGAVLISFSGDLVGVNSSGRGEMWSRQMQSLGDRLLAAIDDGKFDPSE